MTGRRKTRSFTFDELSPLVKYDPDTGHFFSLTDAELRILRHNRGYVVVSLCGVQFLAHRLAWLLMTREWPPEHTDHINRDRSDNRWVNLRLASISQNNANSIKTKPRNLPTGVWRNSHKTKR